jgi:hypothetical protein
MVQENKELLLKDLCSRLPYEVKVEYKNKIFDIDYISSYQKIKLDDFTINYTVDISEVKPYLFPISSMTEEQKEDMIKSSVGIGSDKNVFDWYNKNHFDYRGLIKKGLAIDATGLNVY